MQIPIEIIVAILSSLLTYLVNRLITLKRNTEIRKLQEMLKDIFTALCNTNGYGQKFLEAYEEVQNSKHRLNL